VYEKENTVAEIFLVTRFAFVEYQKMPPSGGNNEWYDGDKNRQTQNGIVEE